ncbi:unnamed protein product [Polarella glacialis]|uniref:Uncharacterized protein n=1 Tax=Polarella glacialis TaxID=89957 RepID=A0A813EK83_POLGL|nr:unnamed protein product [Polarella glacialis]
MLWRKEMSGDASWQVQEEMSLGDCTRVEEHEPSWHVQDDPPSSSILEGELVQRPEEALKCRIRSTFLLACAWKRWQELVFRARSSAAASSSWLPSPIPARCRPPTPPKRHAQQHFSSPNYLQVPPIPSAAGTGPVRAVHLSGVATPNRARAPSPRDDCVHEQRAAARLLHMVLRAPAARSCGAALSAWRVRALCKSLHERAQRDWQQRERALTLAAEDAVMARAEAEAEAQLQGRLRQLEAQRSSAKQVPSSWFKRLRAALLPAGPRSWLLL